MLGSVRTIDAALIALDNEEETRWLSVQLVRPAVHAFGISCC